MKALFCLIRSFARDDSGQDLIEYALIATLVCLIAITGLNSFATKIASQYTAIGNGM